MFHPLSQGGGKPPPTPSSRATRPPPEPPPVSPGRISNFQIINTRTFAHSPSTASKFTSFTLSALHLPRIPQFAATRNLPSESPFPPGFVRPLFPQHLGLRSDLHNPLFQFPFSDPPFTLTVRSTPCFEHCFSNSPPSTAHTCVDHLVQWSRKVGDGVAIEYCFNREMGVGDMLLNPILCALTVREVEDLLYRSLSTSLLENKLHPVDERVVVLVDRGEAREGKHNYLGSPSIPTSSSVATSSNLSSPSCWFRVVGSVEQIQERAFWFFCYIGTLYSPLGLALVVDKRFLWVSVGRTQSSGLKDHHHPCKNQAQIGKHSDISLFVRPQPSYTLSLLDTQRCIVAKRCIWNTLSKVTRSGINEQEGSGKPLDGVSYPNTVVNIGKFQWGGQGSSAQVERNTVPWFGQTLRPPAKPPDYGWSFSDAWL